MSSDLSIVIPAYNEEASLESFLPELLEFCSRGGHQAIVVDDGSSDGTRRLLDRYRDRVELTVVTNKVNRGYGGAVKAGLERAVTPYVVTIDADGQHGLDDVAGLYDEIRTTDADLIVGDRTSNESRYRRVGKALIRRVAKLLMPVPIRDLNSGMKIYRTDLVQRYLHLAPNSMAFSDVITLVFLSQKHLVLERPVTIAPRREGRSTISTMTAFETVGEIINIVVLFNPMRIFLPLSITLILAGIAWGTPIVIRGRGVSIGAMLSVISGLILFFLALIAQQLSAMRRNLGSHDPR